jgi:hypothetical protein
MSLNGANQTPGCDLTREQCALGGLLQTINPFVQASVRAYLMSVSMTALNNAGNVSIVCVGVNQVVLISYFLNNFRRLGAPNSPRERYPGDLISKAPGHRNARQSRHQD